MRVGTSGGVEMCGHVCGHEWGTWTCVNRCVDACGHVWTNTWGRVGVCEHERTRVDTRVVVSGGREGVGIGVGACGGVWTRVWA